MQVCISQADPRQLVKLREEVHTALCQGKDMPLKETPSRGNQVHGVQHIQQLLLSSTTSPCLEGVRQTH